MCTTCQDASDVCCKSNRDCGDMKHAPQCNVVTQKCEACTTNSSCQTFAKGFCVRGVCMPTFNYTRINNCTKYDSLGYCTNCSANFTVYKGQCVRNCSSNDTCKTFRNLSLCDASAKHCSECRADSDCALTGFQACVNGRCEACQNDSYCAANPFDLSVCQTRDYTCKECT
jgi:hypothetical protein